MFPQSTVLLCGGDSVPMFPSKYRRKYGFSSDFGFVPYIYSYSIPAATRPQGTYLGLTGLRSHLHRSDQEPQYPSNATLPRWGEMGIVTTGSTVSNTS